MGNITLNGSTSGQITLAPTAVAGSNIITLPAATGTLLTTAGGQTISGTTTATNLTVTGTATLPSSTSLTTPTLATPNIISGLTLTGAAGTSGQVLTSAGSGSAPTWSTPSAGAMTLISTITTTGTQTSVSWTGLSGYDNYIIITKNLASYTGAGWLQLQFGNSGSYITSGYSGWPNGANSGYTGSASINLSASFSEGNQNAGGNGFFTITNMTAYPKIIGMYGVHAAGVYVSQGWVNSATANQIQLFYASSAGGTQLTLIGQASLYGISS